LYASVVLLGAVVMDPPFKPPTRVTVPPAPIAIPTPFEKVPDKRFRLFIVIVDVVGKLTEARFRVSVPRVVPEKPTSVGNVPEPSIAIVEPLVTDRSSGASGP
jgi:hypothetical protein